MGDNNNFDLSNILNNINLNDIAKNVDMFQNFNSSAYNPVNSTNPGLSETMKIRKNLEEVSKEITQRNKEQELRDIRNLQINEERLKLDTLKIFLLQSVNRDQKEVLEKIDSLIDTVDFGNKVEEANLAIIEKELLDIKQSTDNLNESFIKLIEKKMTEMGVEAAIKYFFVGMKLLFFNQQQI